MAAMSRERGGGPALVYMTVLALLAGAGCGSDAPALGRDDVTGLPPGNAVGSTFSGSYLVDSGAITGCTCRVGSCGAITGMTGAVITIVQQDGMLTMTQANANTEPEVGGIDADGRFSLGSATEQPGFAEYSRSDGTFVLLGGQPDSASFTAAATIIVAMPGLNFDCDIYVAGTWRYQGP
jgi:hypothetical protein